MDVRFCVGQVVTKLRAVATHFLPPASRCASGGNNPMWSPHQQAFPVSAHPVLEEVQGLPWGRYWLLHSVKTHRVGEPEMERGFVEQTFGQPYRWNANILAMTSVFMRYCAFQGSGFSGCVSVFDLFSGYFLVWCLFSPLPLISDV